MSSSLRQLGPLDQWLDRVQRRLAETTLATAPASQQAPADPEQRRHAAALMRVNHAGEVAAQGLYHGQARLARDPATRQQLEQAAREEQEHLDLCAQRLDELGSAPSVLEPLWYAGSVAIGSAAGLLGDKVSLGFVAETEAQVEAHLNKHLQQLPEDDERSRRIVRKMRDDEIEHGAAAREAGGQELPPLVKRMMKASAKLMTTTAYWI